MNVKFGIVLEGLSLAQSKAQLLRQSFAVQSTEMLTRRDIGSHPFADPNSSDSDLVKSISIGHTVEASSLSPQLTNVIRVNIRQSYFGPRTANGGLL